MSAEDVGKKIKVSVQCIDENSDAAPVAMSKETGIIRDSQPIKVILNSFSDSDKPTAEFAITSQAAGEAVLLIGIYDDSNMLRAMSTKTVELEEGENTVSISADSFDGKAARVFVISDMTGMRPFFAAEIIK